MRLRTLGAVCATSAVAAPIAIAPSAFAQAPAPTPVQPLVAAPGDLHAGALALLANRHVHFARRYNELLGDPLTRSERSALRAQLGRLTPFSVRAETDDLRGDIRTLRRKLERRIVRKRQGGDGSSVAVSPHLQSIAACESGGNPRAISPGGDYRGKYQFSFSTWASVGGSGDPAAASESEQDRRAATLMRVGGAGHWPVCGS